MGLATEASHGKDGVAFLIAGGIALIVGILFMLMAGSRLRMRIFAVIGGAAYIAGLVGVWWAVVFIPAAIALIIAILGRRMAGRQIANENPQEAMMPVKAAGFPNFSRRGIPLKRFI